MAETPVHEDKAELIKYELGYHLVPSLGEEALALRVTALQEVLTKAGAVPIAESYPEPRELAYTMKRLRGGRYDRYDRSHFGWVRFEAPASGVKELGVFTMCGVCRIPDPESA